MSGIHGEHAKNLLDCYNKLMKLKEQPDSNKSDDLKKLEEG